MDAGTWRGIFTLILLLLFVAIWVWAWRPGRRRDFDAASRLPLESGDAPPSADEKTGDDRS